MIALPPRWRSGASGTLSRPRLNRSARATRAARRRGWRTPPRSGWRGPAAERQGGAANQAVVQGATDRSGKRRRQVGPDRGTEPEVAAKRDAIGLGEEDVGEHRVAQVPMSSTGWWTAPQWALAPRAARGSTEFVEVGERVPGTVAVGVARVPVEPPVHHLRADTGHRGPHGDIDSRQPTALRRSSSPSA